MSFSSFFFLLLEKHFRLSLSDPSRSIDRTSSRFSQLRKLLPFKKWKQPGSDSELSSRKEELHFISSNQTGTIPSFVYYKDLCATEYHDDILAYLLRTEPAIHEASIQFLFYDDVKSLVKQRFVLLDYIYKLHRNYLFNSHTLFLSVNIMDRILSKTTVQNFDPVIISVVCLFIAGKYHEIDSPYINVLYLFFIFRSLTQTKILQNTYNIYYR